MTDFAVYLMGVKAKLGIKTNTQLAEKVGIAQTYVTRIVKGGYIPSDEVCLRIAELSGDDPEKVLLLAHRVKASPKSRPHWESIFKKVAASSLVILFILVVAPAVFPSPAQGADFTVYILCQVFGLFYMA